MCPDHAQVTDLIEKCLKFLFVFHAGIYDSTPIEGITQWDLSLSDLLGEGANAKVFREKIGANFYAVKVNSDLASFNQEKLSFMISNPPSDLYIQHEGSSYPKYAWALSLVKNLEIGHSGTEIGYIMPLIDRKRSKTLEYFYDFNLSKQLTNPLNKALSFKIEILKNLASKLGAKKGL